MKEVDILLTVRYSDAVDESTALWAIDKLQEADVIYNIGYSDDEFSVYSRVVERREGP